MQRLRDDPAARGLDLSSYLLTPSKSSVLRLSHFDNTGIQSATYHSLSATYSPGKGLFKFHHLWLISRKLQILKHTYHEPERQQLDASITEVERILDAINEEIRDNDGRERLRYLSNTLWLGQGCVTSSRE